ncbi:hypothetical protein L873DRAFT_1803579 [Choiromyces venosus 120613-1]|uniref:Uncharacterized protein n=1 Tax=Choiromyces venosus 120613-1 TaxID=1336337 RepID=A0A3N4JSV8_9PEZI|nr:hypothetical protein L873DRAFT_1803579 [Choiromyces venosus 120613-1]
MSYYLCPYCCFCPYSSTTLGQPSEDVQTSWCLFLSSYLGPWSAYPPLQSVLLGWGNILLSLLILLP